MGIAELIRPDRPNPLGYGTAPALNHWCGCPYQPTDTGEKHRKAPGLDAARETLFAAATSCCERGSPLPLRIGQIGGLAYDGKGTLYASDTTNNCILRITIPVSRLESALASGR